jgi:hypothetical protein
MNKQIWQRVEEKKLRMQQKVPLPRAVLDFVV